MGIKSKRAGFCFRVRLTRRSIFPITKKISGRQDERAGPGGGQNRKAIREQGGLRGDSILQAEEQWLGFKARQPFFLVAKTLDAWGQNKIIFLFQISLF